MSLGLLHYPTAQVPICHMPADIATDMATILQHHGIANVLSL